MNRFITIQVGARRNYAIPSILENAGMLEALYTDVCADVGLGHWLDKCCPKSLKTQGSVQRLLNRKLPSTLKHKTLTCDRSAVQYLIQQKISGRNYKKQHSALVSFSKSFGRQILEKGLGKATHVFSMFGEGVELLREAKKCNLKTVTELYLSPMTHSIVQSERAKHPDFESLVEEEVIRRDYDFFDEVCQYTDMFLVPSKFVQESLSAFGISEDKCRMIPYAINDTWFNIKTSPIAGRVLFVGTAELRKGIHILGQTAKKLAHLGYDFRVAGGVSEIIRNHPETKSLNFLGRVPRSEIQKEYEKADIFVLPSLAEGSAEVTYEALAAGLPVITTTASGSVVRDNVDGFIVSERSSSELADRIRNIVENRELRNKMSEASRTRAKEYTWDKYSQRLISVLSNV